jgi:hypothetical protein
VVTDFYDKSEGQMGLIFLDATHTEILIRRIRSTPTVYQDTHVESSQDLWELYKIWSRRIASQELSARVSRGYLLERKDG